MTTDQLLEVINSWENLALTIREIENHPKYLGMLMDIALYSTEKYSWRAAWMVDKINENRSELILPYIEAMIAKLNGKLDRGKMRHFLKLISQHEIPVEHYGFLLEFCLKLLTSDKEPPAVRVHAMQILYNLTEYEPGLKAEILAVIDTEMELHATPGIISRGSKLVKKLRE